MVSKEDLSNHLHCPQRQRWHQKFDNSCSLEVTKPRLGDLWSELLRRGFIYLEDSLT